jgi:hypothetical protein
MPVELGWRLPHVDIVADYAFYVPVGTFRHAAPTAGLGTGHFAHEFSLGSTLYLDEDRTWSLSALGTFALNTKDRDVDVTPGNVIDIDAGAGKRLFGWLDLGVVSFFHWQVSDDQGEDVTALRGVRTQLFSLGPEVDVTIQKIRTVLTFRYEYDLHAQARTAGQTFVGAITFGAWKPPEPEKELREESLPTIGP